MSGQQIRLAEKKDLLTYHCLNRWDEDPFDTALTNTSKVVEWLDAVNTPCNGTDHHEGKLFIRCMGQNVDQCVPFVCKYLILIALSCQCARDFDLTLILLVLG